MDRACCSFSTESCDQKKVNYVTWLHVDDIIIQPILVCRNIQNQKYSTNDIAFNRDILNESKKGLTIYRIIHTKST